MIVISRLEVSTDGKSSTYPKLSISTVQVCESMGKFWRSMGQVAYTQGSNNLDLKLY